MPNASPSRSVGPLPPTSTTAGSSRRRRACAGFDIVPASRKPLLGIFTCSSFGREMVTLRDDTEAMSSRTTSSDCSGTLKRSSRPVSSVQMSASSWRARQHQRRRGAARADQARRGLNLLGGRLADADGERHLRQR